ncbi:S-adenosyl-L-methionine-dependent methyltransferase [Rhizophagus irregularis]|uniref:S-adenosyl-L-methionine-dependent methyltransferase n=1 Tax=Rhizophagus irregularis TaxID=588596 RepID=A0A2N1P176_9GLOM|nr:S-adenosyl-L-methionine-dependent methyltransferase [Rhizophagus irregularis]
MGRKKKNRGANRNTRQKGDNEVTVRRTERKTYEEAEKKNETFEKYYKDQNIISDEAEWKKFMEVNATILPTAFRITGSRRHAFELRDLMKREHIPKLIQIQLEIDQKSEPIKPLPWYPNELGWQHSASRMTIKKDPIFQTFHRWLVAETEVGNISRQEAVSMIPPLLLDVKPNHWVLDMCAAPGSKTAQIIEAIHANDAQEIGIPSGIVIANDSDSKRSYMLVHQTKRLRSPCLLVTNHDAQHFPNIHLKKSSPPVQFDRILVDVPCSGDGTMRKNLTIWSNWNIGNAIGLHPTQVNILLRGAQLAKEGGRLVYSTCSLNPLENEAVVAEVLRRSRGNLILVDVNDRLPELRKVPGMTSWKVMSKEGSWVSSLDDINPKYRKKYAKSLWMPPDVEKLNLTRCIRIYPHLQDTGGFFIAVFEKIGIIKDVSVLDDTTSNDENGGENSITESVDNVEADSTTIKYECNDDVNDIEEMNQDDSVSTKRPSSTNQSIKGSHKRIRTNESTTTFKSNCENEEEKPKSKQTGEVFIFLGSDNEDIPLIREFYGLSEDFKTDQLLVRSENEKNKILYLVSDSVKQVLSATDVHKLRLVNTGIKIFTRQDTNEPVKCPFRFNAEGMYTVYPYLSNKRVINFGLKEVRILLSEPTPLFDQFDEKIREQLESFEIGCIVAYIDPSQEEEIVFRTKVPIVLPIWRAHKSLNLLYRKEDRKVLELRVQSYFNEEK